MHQPLPTGRIASVTSIGSPSIDQINLERGKRYPLVIDGPNQGRWTHHGQFFANIGCYYAAVNRRGLFSSEQLHDAAEDILTAHAHLIEKPSINPDRVYLIGFSAATRVTINLASQYPDKWTGVLLNNPIAAPPIPTRETPLPPIYISLGDTEQTETGLKRYFTATTPVTYHIHSNAGHTFRGARLQHQRLKLASRYISNDR